jgi:hypothetical protein
LVAEKKDSNNSQVYCLSGLSGGERENEFPFPAARLNWLFIQAICSGLFPGYTDANTSGRENTYRIDFRRFVFQTQLLFIQNKRK